MGAVTDSAEDTKTSPDGTLSDKALASTMTNGVATLTSVNPTAVGEE